LNVREATHKQILENAEINNLIKILGLQYKKKYETREDLKTLRYGKIMIMTDQDQVIITFIQRSRSFIRPRISIITQLSFLGWFSHQRSFDQFYSS
jgi:hypothetical protein